MYYFRIINIIHGVSKIILLITNKLKMSFKKNRNFVLFVAFKTIH